MKNRTPEGLTTGQWNAVITGLEDRPSTVNDYRKVLNLLHSYRDGALHIGTLTKDQAAEYFAYLDQRGAEGTLSENTIHRYKATLRSIGTRIEKRPDIWPGYSNPFSRLVTNENRKRTEFREDLFADPSVIRKIIDVLLSLSLEDRLILSLMLYAGLTPAQIQDVKISDFTAEGTGNRRLSLKVRCGTFLEYTSKPWKESIYYTENYPVHYVRKSPNRSITWEYTGTFLFSPEFEELLREYYEYIGISTDSRAFFLTTRHLEFNYRAMHHMILNTCAAAEIDPKMLTPNRISRFGMIHSGLLFEASEQLNQLEPGDSAEREALEERIRSLKEIGFIGGWVSRYPVPLRERLDSIRNTLGADFPAKAIGLE